MKKYLLGIIAVALAIGFSAFTAEKTNSAKSFTSSLWFHFDGTAPGDLNNASKYSVDGDGSQPFQCPNTTETYRCDIFAVPQSGDPDLPDLTTITYQTRRNNP